MSDQPSLFGDEPGPWHHNAPATSRQAALDNAPRAGTQRARVLSAIAGSAGMTDHELVELLELSPSSERPRRVELQQAGLVTSAGLTRPTPLGSEATVWIATDAGRSVAWSLQERVGA